MSPLIVITVAPPLPYPLIMHHVLKRAAPSLSSRCFNLLVRFRRVEANDAALHFDDLVGPARATYCVAVEFVEATKTRSPVF